MHTLTAKRVEVGRQRCNQRLALARAHLGDVAVVQHHATDKLYIERAHAHRTHRRFPRYGKGLGQYVIQRLTARDARFQLAGFRAQLLVVQTMQLFLEPVYFVDDLRILAQEPLVAAAKNTGQKVGHSGLLDFNAHGAPAPRGQKRVILGFCAGI